MRGGRYGKYGELKRNERLRASKEARRRADKKVGIKKIKSGSRAQKFESDKFFSNKERKTTNETIKCECGGEMEFYGVDGTGGSKYNCIVCYEKKVIG